jgi:hypothetical protein
MSRRDPVDFADATAQRQKMPLTVQLLREAEDRATRQVISDAAKLTLAFIAYVFGLLALRDVARSADDLRRLCPLELRRKTVS